MPARSRTHSGVLLASFWGTASWAPAYVGDIPTSLNGWSQEKSREFSRRRVASRGWAKAGGLRVTWWRNKREADTRDGS